MDAASQQCDDRFDSGSTTSSDSSKFKLAKEVLNGDSSSNLFDIMIPNEPTYGNKFGESSVDTIVYSSLTDDDKSGLTNMCSPSPKRPSNLFGDGFLDFGVGVAETWEKRLSLTDANRFSNSTTPDNASVTPQDMLFQSTNNSKFNFSSHGTDCQEHISSAFHSSYSVVNPADAPTFYPNVSQQRSVSDSKLNPNKFNLQSKDFSNSLSYVLESQDESKYHTTENAYLIRQQNAANQPVRTPTPRMLVNSYASAPAHLSLISSDIFANQDSNYFDVLKQGRRTVSPDFGCRGISTAGPASRNVGNSLQSKSSIGSTTGVKPSIGLNLSGLEDFSIEDIISKSCRDILTEAASHSLKAVELANTLRARVGTDVLAMIRERWGGLLSLLERHPDMFFVERIPKNDMVTLAQFVSHNKPQNQIYQQQVPYAAPEITRNATTLSKTHSHSMYSVPIPADISENDRLFGPSRSFSDSSINSPGYFSNLTHDVHYNIMDSQPMHSFPNTEIQNQQSQFSKCLHVGNVPSNISDDQLRLEFEQFGEIESIKIIVQRSRRFAFITFRNIQQAVSAKQQLSRLHTWKSSISFAHRDSIKSMTGGPHSILYQQSNGGIQHQTSYRAAPLDHYQSHAEKIDFSPIDSRYIQNSSFSIMTDTLVSERPTGGAQDSEYSSNSIFSVSKNIHSHRNINEYPEYPSMAQSHRENSARSRLDDPVLQRLCDDTYVPTQIWQKNLTLDSHYCQAIVSQLQHFGGSTTVSKLRGFLRNRVNAQDNIKSVPLKALLAAYPELFCISSNQVSLARSSNQATVRRRFSDSQLNI